MDGVKVKVSQTTTVTADTLEVLYNQGRTLPLLPSFPLLPLPRPNGVFNKYFRKGNRSLASLPLAALRSTPRPSRRSPLKSSYRACGAVNSRSSVWTNSTNAKSN